MTQNLLKTIPALAEKEGELWDFLLPLLKSQKAVFEKAQELLQAERKGLSSYQIRGELSKAIEAHERDFTEPLRKDWAAFERKKQFKIFEK